MPLNGSYHNVSTVAPFFARLQQLTTHPRSCDPRKLDAQARQRRTPFWCQRNTVSGFVKTAHLRLLTSWRLHINCIFGSLTAGSTPLTSQNLHTAEIWLANSQTVNRNMSNFLVLYLFVFFIIP